MKKIVMTIMMLLFASVSFAETITLLGNAKPGGSFDARTQLYKAGLEAQGYSVDFENIGQITQASKIFKQADKPTIMVWANMITYTQDLHHTADNLILLEYEQPMWICTTNKAKGKTGKLTVAYGKGYDNKLLKQILGSDIVLVPYKNSSEILKGLLADDVDVAVNNQGKSLKYAASGQGTCEPSEVLPIAQATVIGTNVDVEKLRSSLMTVINSPEFVDYHTKRKLTRPNNLDRLGELDLINKKTPAWKVK